MRTILAVLFVASAASAQSQSYITSPPAWRPATNGGCTLVCNASAAWTDGDLIGRKLAISEVAFTGSGLARNGKVTLLLAESDRDGTRATNSKTVFNSKIVLPKRRTTDWNIKFPFSATWNYSGRRHMRFEMLTPWDTLYMVFTASAWTEPLQTCASYAEVHVPYRHFPSLTASNCRDTGSFGQGPARFDSEGPNHCFGASVLRRRHPLNPSGRTILHGGAVLRGVAGPAIAIVSRFGSEQGLPFPNRCGFRLHVDIAKAAMMTSASDGNILFGSRGWRNIKIPPALDGQTLWFQAAYTDSKTGAFKLSAATTVTLPTEAPTDKFLIYTKQSLMNYVMRELQPFPRFRVN